MTKHTAAPEAAPPPEVVADPLAGLTRGRVVWYTPMLPEARYADAGPWPAMVVHVGPENMPGQVTLVVFLPVPTLIGGDPCARRVEVPFSASGEPGTWAWPERS